MKKKLSSLNKLSMPALIINSEEENARKLIENRSRLVALNALFDAVQAGEPGRHIASDIAASGLIKKEKIIRHLSSYNDNLQHW